MDKKQIKERLCIRGFEFKEDTNTYTGLIATTHPDRVGDILSRKSLQQMADYINDTSRVGSEEGHYRGISLYHDWILQNDPTLDEAGRLLPTARVVELDDGHYGVEVDAVVNDFYKGDISAEEIKSRIENEMIGGFSIEYRVNENGIRPVNVEGEEFRFIDELDDFVGVAFARSRLIANPYAVIYKEIESALGVNHVNPNQTKEDSTMAEEQKIEQPQEVKEEQVEQNVEQVSEKTEEVVESAEVSEVKEEKPEEESESEEEKKKDEEESESEVKESVEEESEAEESKDEEAEVKEVKIKEVVEAKIKEAIAELKPEKKVIKQIKEDTKMAEESISIKEMKEAIDKQDVTSFKSAARKYFKEVDFDQAFQSHGVPLRTTAEIKCEGTKLRVMGFETKDVLNTGSNATTYTQSAAELADIYVPGLVDTFNNRTDLFSILEKRDHIMGSENYGWRITTDQKSGLSVDVDNPTVTKGYSGKLKLQTPIKEYRNGIEVTDFMISHSRAAIGDLFMIEAEKAMKDLRKDINKDLFTEQADGDGTKVLGLEAVADSTGNATLYGLTRSVANRLKTSALADTYVPVGGALTTAVIRNGLTKVETEGAERGNLLIVTSPKQRDALFELVDAQQQLFTNPDFGFSGAIRFDGVPVIPDSDCQTDALFIVDRESYYVVMSKAPQLVGLAKVAASESAYVVTNLAVVYEQPRRIHMLDTLA